MNPADTPRPQLEIQSVHLDTGRENVVVISRQSKALRAEIFRGFIRTPPVLLQPFLQDKAIWRLDAILVPPDQAIPRHATSVLLSTASVTFRPVLLFVAVPDFTRWADINLN